MRKLLLITALLLFVQSLFGQEENSIPENYSIDMFPKTPNDAALSKFIDIPPGSYTGVANFTIPIYTIDFDGGKIPIELNYSTSGIKVGEIASRVGLGWALNVGPSLSQQVIGDYDKWYEKPVIPNESLDVDYTLCYASDGYDDNEPCGILLHATGLLYPRTDLKPDIFSYSLINANGQFIMDSSRDFGIPRPYNQIKIRQLGTIPNPITGMEMIDETGNIYTFSAGIETTNFNSCNMSNEELNPPNYKLTSIKSSNNEVINYIYSKQTKSRYITSVMEQELIDHIIVPFSPNPPYTPAKPSPCINFTLSGEYALSEIDFKGGKVFFYYNNDPDGFVENVRQDLFYDENQGDVYLTRVIVKDEKNNVIKDVSLNYDYFVSDPPNDDLYNDHLVNSPNANGITKRLKLKEVKNNLISEEYKLIYYEDHNLPYRASHSQDYWGVYNGQPNIKTAIPTVKTGDLHNPQNVGVYFGANKNPDINYGVTGNLKEIEYPTGGNTIITYEADDYLKAEYIPPVYEYQLDEQSLEMIVNENEIETFTIPENAINKRFLFYGTQWSGGPPPSTPCSWTLSRLENGSYTQVGSGINTTSAEDPENPEYSWGQPRYDEPGDYKLEVLPAAFPSGDCYATYIWWNEITVDDSDTRKTGTLRVKKLEYNSVDNGKITREFKYEYPPDYQDSALRGKSSGKNLGDEIFSPLSTKLTSLGVAFPTGTYGYVTELIKSNNPGWQTNTVRGKPVGYDYVQEIYTSENPSENFKKEYKFKNEQYDGNVQHDPVRPYDLSWPINGLDRGLLLEERLFDNTGKLVRNTENEYLEDPYFNQSPYSSMSPYENPYSNNVVMTLALEANVKTIIVGPFGEKTYTFYGESYAIPNYWIKNFKTTTTDYVNGQPKMVTEVTNEYSPSYNHTFLSKSITENSLGETLQTEYKYPQDLTSGYEQSSLMQEMVNRNMIATPVKTVTKNNGTVTSEQRTLYDYFSGLNGQQLILPEYVYAKKGSGTTSADKKITYDKYDENGNLLQYTLADGTPVSIIWGYNKQYPIAKVEGVAYTTISSQAGTLAGLSDSGDLTETSFETLRNTSGALVTCYIYEPLVGVKTIIQPNGQKEVYEYDSSGRLAQVKDQDGNILRKIDYNYQH